MAAAATRKDSGAGSKRAVASDALSALAAGDHAAARRLARQQGQPDARAVDEATKVPWPGLLAGGAVLAIVVVLFLLFAQRAGG